MYSFWAAVQQCGGYEACTRQQLWTRLGSLLTNPSSTCPELAFRIRNCYIDAGLLEFEKAAQAGVCAVRKISTVPVYLIQMGVFLCSGKVDLPCFLGICEVGTTRQMHTRLLSPPKRSEMPVVGNIIRISSKDGSSTWELRKIVDVAEGSQWEGGFQCLTDLVQVLDALPGDLRPEITKIMLLVH